MSAELIAFAEQVMAERKAAAEKLEVLNPDQRACLLLVAHGLPYKTVARQLNVSDRTVGWRMERACQRLQMPTLAAVVLAAKAGWV